MFLNIYNSLSSGSTSLVKQERQQRGVERGREKEEGRKRERERQRETEGERKERNRDRGRTKVTHRKLLVHYYQ